MHARRIIPAVALAALLVGGCKLDVRLVPAIVDAEGSGDPMLISPALVPVLPERVGGRGEEVVGFALFDRYLLVGEPATGLLRVNRHNLPWRQRVHFEIWDEPGLNLFSEGVVTVQPDETYLVQIPSLSDAKYADKSLQLRVRANVFQVIERVHVLSRPPVPPARPAPKPPALLPTWLGGEPTEQADPLAGGVFPVPLPAGPTGPNDEPLCLLATPGETVAGLAVLWPIEGIANVVSAVAAAEPEGSLPAVFGPASIDLLDLRKRVRSRVGPDGAELEPARSNLLVLTVAVPAASPASACSAQWVIRQGGDVLFHRRVHLIVYDVSLPAVGGEGAATQARYMAALKGMVQAARGAGSSQTRALADRLEKQVDRAAEYYAARTGGGAVDQLLAPEGNFPFKLRWMILRAIEQLRSAGGSAP